MDIALQSPILVIDGLDVSIYPSIDAAVADLEGIDVADGVYEVFDAAGRRITLRAKNVRRGRFSVNIGTVHFDHAEDVPTGGAALKSRLLQHLEVRGLGCSRDADLTTIVRLVQDRSGS